MAGDQDTWTARHCRQGPEAARVLALLLVVVFIVALEEGRAGVHDDEP